VEVSSGEDNVPKIDASAYKRKAPDGDDDEDGGASSTELIAPNPMRSNTLQQADSSITNRATSIVPPASGPGCKHSMTAIRRNQPLSSANHVMSQIEFPPYREPHSPLNLIIVEIIFEAFRRIS
jgi:hypothetical protein